MDGYSPGPLISSARLRVIIRALNSRPELWERTAKSLPEYDGAGPGGGKDFVLHDGTRVGYPGSPGWEAYRFTSGTCTWMMKADGSTIHKDGPGRAETGCLWQYEDKPHSMGGTWESPTEHEVRQVLGRVDPSFLPRPQPVPRDLHRVCRPAQRPARRRECVAQSQLRTVT